jgi:hypothetical protein
MQFLFYGLLAFGCTVAGYQAWKPWGGLIGAGVSLAVCITKDVLYRRRKARDTRC